MRLFRGGKVYDFMAVRGYFIGFSLFLTVGSLILLLFGQHLPFGHPKLGTDFRGGTEVEIAFPSKVDAGDVRRAVQSAGFSSPDVIKIDDFKHPYHYLIRVQEVSTISHQTQLAAERALCLPPAAPASECPPERQATEVKFSPGGDKISARFHQAPDLSFLRERLLVVKGLSLRPGQNPVLQNARDQKVEVLLQSQGDQLIAGLKRTLGNRAPEDALRAEWIGPRAGAQLRDAAIKSIAIAIVFIMAYIAFRFDVRFAPGGIVALIHDALGTAGILVLLGEELNLTTVAAILTIIGYSVNDTVVIYDRVRENLTKLRGVSFKDLINVSTSEMLGRTLLTNTTVQISVLGLFVWGTGTLKEFALTLTIGMVLGTYSSIYVALPLTDFFDKYFFDKFGGAGPKKKAPLRKRAQATV